jgi:2-polyprenyl-3-methyl-5-hydroxy-6-metoxy-1,4-benzoquinol methylase
MPLDKTEWEADMSSPERLARWEKIYRTTGEREVSWFEERPAISVDLIRSTGVGTDASIVDIGGGASRLVDVLIDEGYGAITVLDLSAKALATSRSRLGARGVHVNWIVADVTTWQPTQTFDVWHDRAAFHFLTEPADCSAYVECVRKAVRLGGHVIIGTFALDGPERCSGLPVSRHDAGTLGAVLGSSFNLIESRRHEHMTPGGVIQRFQFSRFPHVGGGSS